jgi:hypothetical protein
MNRVILACFTRFSEGTQSGFLIPVTRLLDWI